MNLVGEDKGIRSLIETRARQAAEDPEESQEEYVLREARDRERRRLQGNRAAWRLYFLRLARSHDRRAREYEARAAALKEASS